MQPTFADWVVVALRAATFAAVLQAAGVAIFTCLFGSQLRATHAPIARLGTRTAATALLLAVLQQLLEPARLIGTLGGAFDLSLQTLALTSGIGAATTMRLAGLGFIALGSRGYGSPVAGPLGAGLVTVSFALLGHTSTHEQRPLLAALLVVHVAVVAFWFGALLPLRLVTAHETAAVAARLVARFSRIAAWLVPVILLAGIALAVVLLPDLSSIDSPFDRVLAFKLGAFALLMAAAIANKWRLGPALAAGGAPAVLRFRRSVQAEWALIVIVITATAVLTAFFSPEQ